MFKATDTDGDTLTARAMDDVGGPYMGGFAIRAEDNNGRESAAVYLTEREALDLALFIFHGGDDRA